MAEHKRRARWRLLGSIILIGVVAAAAPYFLEDEARPLAEDLLIEIPSKASVFNKLSGGPAEKPASDKPSPEPEARPSALTPPVPTKEAAPPAPAKDAAPPAPAKDAAAPSAPASSAASPQTGSGPVFYVQVGAYAKAESANQVKRRLEASGHTVLVQTIKTADGAERHRVRIGPFETRAQANELQVRAKLQGYDAAVVTR